MSEAPLSEIPFPTWGSMEDRAAFLVRYAVLAPSSHNSQPWRFCVEGDTIAILPDLQGWLALPHLRQELRALLPPAEAWPQVLFRLGHSRPAARRTSRLPVDAVLARP